METKKSYRQVVNEMINYSNNHPNASNDDILDKAIETGNRDIVRVVEHPSPDNFSDMTNWYLLGVRRIEAENIFCELNTIYEKIKELRNRLDNEEQGSELDKLLLSIQKKLWPYKADMNEDLDLLNEDNDNKLN